MVGLGIAHRCGNGYARLVAVGATILLGFRPFGICWWSPTPFPPRALPCHLSAMAVPAWWSVYLSWFAGCRGANHPSTSPAEESRQHSHWGCRGAPEHAIIFQKSDAAMGTYKFRRLWYMPVANALCVATLTRLSPQAPHVNDSRAIQGSSLSFPMAASFFEFPLCSPLSTPSLRGR